MLVLTARPAHAQAIPLQASDTEITDTGILLYSLTSSAAQPATAWSVTIVVEDANNTTMRQSVITVDEYAADAQDGIASTAERPGAWLRPKRPRRFEASGPFDPLLRVTVTPAAIVLRDGTSIGDRELIEGIFHRRVEERDARAELLRQLVDVRAHYAGARALKEAIGRLARSAAPDPGHARRLCERNLRDALARVDAGDIDPAAELSRQIEIVRREYAAAVRHAAAVRQEE